MSIRKHISKILIITVLVSMVMTGAAVAGGEFALMAAKAYPEAQGTTYIDGNNISVHARGLKPDSVYTVWFVNMKPNKHETGAGMAPYMFKTDANGYGSYSSNLSESPFGKWQMMMVVNHPDGDPKNMKSMVGALSAKLM
jgi:hypothetical protein